MSLRVLFRPLLGNWTGVEQLADGGTARAMVTFKLDVSDRVVLQDYRQVRDNGAELTGHGVFLLDPVTQRPALVVLRLLRYATDPAAWFADRPASWSSVATPSTGTGLPTTGCTAAPQDSPEPTAGSQVIDS